MDAISRNEIRKLKAAAQRSFSVVDDEPLGNAESGTSLRLRSSPIGYIAPNRRVSFADDPINRGRGSVEPDTPVGTTTGAGTSRSGSELWAMAFRRVQQEKRRQEGFRDTGHSRLMLAEEAKKSVLEHFLVRLPSHRGVVCPVPLCEPLLEGSRSSLEQHEISGEYTQRQQSCSLGCYYYFS